MLDRVTSSEYRLAWFTLCLLVLLVSYKVPREQHRDTYNYIHQAIAFTKGSVSLATKTNDVAEKDGKYYLAHPPFPAVLLMPFVAIFGVATKTLLLTPILGALAAFFAYRLALKNGVSRDVSRWATLGLVFGTGFLLCLTFPVDTYFANSCAMLFTLIALNEAFGRQRGWLIGFALGFAMLSRQLAALTVPMVWGVLVLRRREGRGLPGALLSVGATAIGLAACTGFYLWLNWVRFGSPFDLGYEYIREGGWYGYRVVRWGTFSWAYVPSNLIRMFLMGFDVEFLPPSYMVPTMGTSGTSLTFSCPFIFYALRGRISGARGLNPVAWAAIGLGCLAVLLHRCALGAWQINGLRYTLDFMPMLFIFVALGLERVWGTCWGKIGRYLIIYSIALNLVAFIVIPAAKLILMRLPH
jgi:hypothetical protein